MKNILMLSSRIPYPLTAGFRIRIFNEAKYCRQIGYGVDLLCIGNLTDFKIYRSELLKIFNHVYCIQLKKCEIVINIFATIFNNDMPFQVALYKNVEFRNLLLSIACQYDVIIGNHIRIAEYLKLLPKNKTILDFHDAISYNYKNAIKVTSGIKKLIYKIEYNRVLTYECKVANFVGKSVIISKEDKIFLKENGAYVENMHIIPVAVRDDIINKKYDYKLDKCRICFLGKMSYQPNEDAVIWFCENVFWKLKRIIPNLEFFILGIEPTKKVRELERFNGVHVTGYLDNPYKIVAECIAMVVPIKNGAGMQNKILESMVIGTPTVISSIAASGLGGEDGQQYLVADDANKYFEMIKLLVENLDLRKQIGIMGQQFITENYTWHSLWKKWNNLIEEKMSN